jgi:membrane protein DedA with SNARE-associated domain
MSTPALPGLFGTVEPFLNHYGYLAVALFVTIEDFGIPVPGETILIAAALFAGAGRLNVVVVGVVATLAAIVGDNIGFAIGHFGGRALALRFGKYVFLTEERLDKAEAFFQRHGGKIIVVARFIEGLRQANGIVAGISGMHWRRFVAFNALGAALWVGTWVTLGYLAGNHITTIYTQITRYSLYALIALALVVVAFIARHLLRRRARRRARAAGEEAAAQESSGASEGREASDGREATETRETAEVSEATETPETSTTSQPAAAPQPSTTPEPAAAPQPSTTPEASEARKAAPQGVDGAEEAQAQGVNGTAESRERPVAPGPREATAGERDRPDA